MIVLDTHAWIWHAADPERLSKMARAAIQGAERIGVATISCWEVAMLAARERIALDRPVAAWVRQALAVAEPLDLTAAIAVGAGSLDTDFPGDPADRIIYATAIVHGATLITRDRALREMDPARTLW